MQLVLNKIYDLSLTGVIKAAKKIQQHTFLKYRLRYNTGGIIIVVINSGGKPAANISVGIAI